MIQRFLDRIQWPVTLAMFIFVMGSLSLTMFFRSPTSPEESFARLRTLLDQDSNSIQVEAILGKKDQYTWVDGHGDFYCWYHNSSSWHFTRKHTPMSFELIWITAYYRSGKLTYCGIETRTVIGWDAIRYYWSKLRNSDDWPNAVWKKID
ncbi:MAG: hypothetical protein QM703_11635 [Gemmatales bacterium]